MNRQTLVIIVLFLVALAAWRYFAPEPEAEIQTGPSTPDFTARNLAMTEFNNLGAVHRYIEADGMEHFSSRNTTEFVEPRITLFPDTESDPTWRVTAREGKLIGQEEAELHIGVLIKDVDEVSVIDRVETESLFLNLEKNTFNTDDAVFIYGQSMFQQGVGMDGDLNQETLHVREKVQAEYEPSP